MHRCQASENFSRLYFIVQTKTIKICVKSQCPLWLCHTFLIRILQIQESKKPRISFQNCTNLFQAATAEHHRLDSLNNKPLFLMDAETGPQIAAFSLCHHLIRRTGTGVYPPMGHESYHGVSTLMTSSEPNYLSHRLHFVLAPY